MRILITNHTLAGRTGTETFVRDLALALKDRGHHPMVYAPELGPLAEVLHEATIPVVDDLTRLAEAPDLIHGHHRHETVAALLRFPHVPAVFVVHDWHSWHDDPPLFPQILRYVAVDESRRDRLVLQHGIAPDRVRIIPNGVDTRRFQPRAPLPARPARGLVFNSYVTSPRQIRDLERACAARGIRLDAVGTGLKRPVAHPEHLLGSYDLVFALGRSAMEAMAVGAGVLLWGLEGLGGFVTPERFQGLLERNFGRRTLHPAAPGELEAALDAWNPDVIRQVQARIRQSHSLDGMVDTYMSLYAEVVAESRAHPAEPEAVFASASQYLEGCVPRVQVESLLGRRSRRSLRRIQWLTDTLALTGLTALTMESLRLMRLLLRGGQSLMAVGVVLGAVGLAGLILHLRSLMRARAGVLARRGWARLLGLA